MLKSINVLGNICKNSVKNRDLSNSFTKWREGGLLKIVNCDDCCINHKNEFHVSVPRNRRPYYERRQIELISVNKRAQTGTLGDQALEMDSLISRKPELFPDETLPDKIFNGTAFQELPIINIRTSKNNTIMSLTNAEGLVEKIRSCGIDGFKNTKKGTNLAAQVVGTNFGSIVVKSGVDTVRVKIRGLGPGRMSGIKGLQLAGLNIVSVTDTTGFTDKYPRGKKRRKL